METLPKFAYLCSSGNKPFGLHVWVVRVWSIEQAPENGWTGIHKSLYAKKHLARAKISKLKAIWSDHTDSISAPRFDGIPSTSVHGRISKASMVPVCHVWADDLCWTQEEVRNRFEDVRAKAKKELAFNIERMKSSLAYYEENAKQCRESIARCETRAAQIEIIEPSLDFDAQEVCDSFKNEIQSAANVAAIDASLPSISSESYLKNPPEWVDSSKIRYRTMIEDGREYIYPIKETSDGRHIEGDSYSHTNQLLQNRSAMLQKMKNRLESL